MLAKLPPAQKALLDAAQYIREHGWCQYTTETVDGRVCAMGAIYRAVSPPVSLYVSPAAGPVQILGHYLGVEFIGEWNDRPERTAEEVIAALEQAALT